MIIIIPYIKNMKTMKYILSIDIGTSSTKALLTTIGGSIIKFDTEYYSVQFGNNGKVEQNPEEVFSKVIILFNRILNNIETKNLVAIVFDGILHSLIPVDKNGIPLSFALLWADTRSKEQSKKLRNLLNNEDIKSKTGCSIHPLYYPSRLLWLKENNQTIFKKSYKFISIKEYILKKLTGEYIIDKSTASGTGLFNIHTEEWDKDLLKFINLDKNKLSEVKEPTHILKIKNSIFRETPHRLIGVPVIIGSSDGPMAHLGSCGLNQDYLSLTIGSSCAMRRLILKPKIINGKEAWCYYLANGYWLLGGVAHDGGIIFQWLKDNIFSTINNSELKISSIDEIAKSVPAGADGLFFLPYLSGERTPNYNPDARGTIFGLSYNHSWKHIIRASMEGTAYRLNTIYNMLSNGKQYNIVLTGGIVHQPTWIKIVAAFLNKKLFLPEIESVSAWGSSILALNALGLISLNDINSFIKQKSTISPNKKLVQYYNKLKIMYSDFYHRLYS